MHLALFLLLISLIKTLQAQKGQTLYSGVTPSNANWESEGLGTVSLEVQTRLSLTSTPTYLCRIVHRFSASSTSFFDFDPLTNVTGACTPRNPTINGFKVRLRYSDERNLTTSKASDWRVVWIATTNKHPGTGKPGSIEAQVELIKQLIEEDQQVVKGLLGPEYYPMERNIPKPKPFKPSSNETSSSDTNSTTSSKEQDNNKTSESKTSS